MTVSFIEKHWLAYCESKRREGVGSMDPVVLEAIREVYFAGALAVLKEFGDRIDDGTDVWTNADKQALIEIMDALRQLQP